MKMTKILNYALSAALVAALAVSCEEWTTPEPDQPTDLTENIKTEEYYANLRAYRKSDHQIMCGYWQGWGGTSQDYRTSLMGLPDSMDIVQLWGAGFEYTENQKADLKNAQEKKGLKCLLVFIAHSIGTQITPSWVYEASEENPVKIRNRYTGEFEEFTDSNRARRAFWGMHPDDGKSNTKEMDEMAVKAAECYADSLCYLINDKLKLDGFDWDFEYGWDVGDYTGDLIGDRGTITQKAAHDRTLAFVKRMREGLGDKMLMIDGEPAKLQAPEACVYFDYFAVQFYTNLSQNSHKANDKAADARLQEIVNAYRPYMEPEKVVSRFIILETSEQNWSVGGVPWTDRFGTPGLRSWLGMARWTPQIDGEFMRKGGIGAYLINNDYTPGGSSNQYYPYPQVREAIQVMNPAVQ